MSRIILPKQAIHTGNLILVNQDYGCFRDAADTLWPVRENFPSVRLQRRAVVLLSTLMEQIGGWERIVPVSGWRSFQEQQQIWDDSLAENGVDFTRKFVAFPGHSEHQTGLAIDLALRQETIDFICPEFPYSGICQVFREQAARFGFIERYPAGREGITGIGHEPWHFRYVGVPHSLIMAEKNLTLEEYIGFLRQFPHGQKPLCFRGYGQEILVSWRKADARRGLSKDTGDGLTQGTPGDMAGNTELEIDTDMPYSISGNNIDGFILTEWRGHYGHQTAAGRT